MLRENIKLALQSMAANKMRTLLSLLGIVIGVASVVAIMTLGQSATNSINEALEIGGLDMVTVMPMGSARELQIFDETFGNTLMKNVAGIDAVLPSAQTNANIRNGQSYYINLQLGESSESVIIPRGSFFSQTGGTWIFVLDAAGERAVRREIRLGRQNPQYYEVLEGLDPGEKVVVSGYEQFGKSNELIFK